MVYADSYGLEDELLAITYVHVDFALIFARGSFCSVAKTRFLTLLIKRPTIFR